MQKHPSVIWDKEDKMWVLKNDDDFDPKVAADKIAKMLIEEKDSRAKGNDYDVSKIWH